MKWRFLGPRDFDWMLDVSKEHHKESDWSEVEYSEDKVKGYITTALKDPNYFAIIVEEDDKRIGFMCGRILEYSFSKGTRIASYHLILDVNNVEDEVAAYRKNFIEPTGTLGEIWKMHNWSGVYHPNYGRDGRQKTCGRPFAPEVTIRANGLVHPCCQVLGRDDDAVLGDLNNQTLKEVWNGSEYRKLRQLHAEGRFADTPYCAECDFLTDDTEVLVWKNSETAMLKMRGTKFSLTDYRD